MKIDFEDREWDFDLDEITLNEARAIKRQTGLTLLKLQEGLDEADPDAFAALYWLMKHQNGVTVDLKKAEFKVVHFGAAIGDAAERERADELGVEVEELREARAEAERRNADGAKPAATIESVLAEQGHGANPTEAPASEPATT